MASAGASGTVTGEDQRSYIKIETLLGKTATEIVAIDKTWVTDFEPELKSQSNEWRTPSSTRPKKFRRAQSNVKEMMIFAYDHRGIIMTDRIPCGTSVTAAYYRDWMQEFRRKMRKNRPDLLGDGPLILHNARPHLRKVVTDLPSKYKWEVLPHAPYSPDMSSPDLTYFPS